MLDSRPETIRKSIEGSLKRLRMGHIDLYYQHRINPQVPEEDVADLMADLIRERKILHWGISEADEDNLRKAHAICPVTAVQNRSLARKYVAFSPLASGFLSGTYQNPIFFRP